MKTIEVTVRRVTYTTYEVEVDDEFDAAWSKSAKTLESFWFSGDGGWQELFEEVASFEIDEVVDNNDNEEN